MIDIWLMFCLLIPFGIFMIEIVWQLNLQSKGEDMHFSGNCVLQCHTFLCQDITKIGFLNHLLFVITLIIAQSDSNKRRTLSVFVNIKNERTLKLYI